MQSNTLSHGYVIHGNQYNYIIEKVLGQGTFGITYLAKVALQGQLGQLDSNVLVTVKEFFMKEINGREGTNVTSSSSTKGGLFYNYKEKFAREAKNLSKLKHPNIVNVMDYFEANNTCYYVMEYLSGGDLDTLIEKRGRLSEEEALRYTKQIGSALSFMHKNKMLHLDLKPKNVMLNATGDAILIDFGLSKQYDSSGEPESSTTVGRGTPGYAPLEQANYQDGHGFPVTMDVYALGATMYKMLTGARAPEASVILNEGFPKKFFKDPHCSQRTLNSIIKAMSPLKKDRFDSIDSFLKFLCVHDIKSTDEETTIELPLRIDNNTQSVEIYYFEGSFPNAISMLLQISASSCTYELYSYQKHLAWGVLHSFNWNDFAKTFNSLNLVHGDERGESCTGGSTTTLFLKNKDSSIVESNQYGNNQSGTLHGNVLKLIAYFETIQEFREELIAAKHKLYQKKNKSGSSNRKMPLIDEARKTPSPKPHAKVKRSYSINLKKLRRFWLAIILMYLNFVLLSLYGANFLSDIMYGITQFVSLVTLVVVWFLTQRKNVSNEPLKEKVKLFLSIFVVFAIIGTIIVFVTGIVSGMIEALFTLKTQHSIVSVAIRSLLSGTIFSAVLVIPETITKKSENESGN